MLLGYDGPLTYAMMNSSPDSSDILGISRHSNNHDIIEGLFKTLYLLLKYNLFL